MGQSLPLFVYFRSFHKKNTIKQIWLKWQKRCWSAHDSSPGRHDNRHRRIHWAMTAHLTWPFTVSTLIEAVLMALLHSIGPWGRWNWRIILVTCYRWRPRFCSGARPALSGRPGRWPGLTCLTPAPGWACKTRQSRRPREAERSSIPNRQGLIVEIT